MKTAHSLIAFTLLSCQTQFSLRNSVPTESNKISSFPFQKIYLPSIVDTGTVSGLSAPLSKSLRSAFLLSQKYELSNLQHAAFSIEVETGKIEFSTTKITECVQKSDTIASQSESCANQSSKTSPTLSAESFVSSGNASVTVKHLDSGTLVLRKNYDKVQAAERDVVAPVGKQPELVATRNLHSLRYSENQTESLNSLAANLSNAIFQDSESAIQNFLKSRSK